MAKVNIQPVKATFTDQVDSTILDVNIAYDNLQDSCNVEWRLMDVDSVNTTAQGTITISGDNYTNWHGDNDFPITQVLQTLNLTQVNS